MTSVAQSIQPETGQENPLEPRLLALYRVATPEQKLTAVVRLNQVLQGLKEAQLADARPELTGAQRQAELRHWWMSARD
ncbi:MAG: hypothetical protein HYX71_08970 [Opitutae bacterium]|nr:hypothetical protein [Opitutae bacterium]